MIMLNRLIVTCLLFSPTVLAIGETEKNLNKFVPKLLNQYNVAGVGIATVTQDGITLEKYYGNQNPTTQLTNTSIFNVASVAKTITAEVAISLLVQNAVTLEDKVASVVTHPDLNDSKAFQDLTLRHLLSHSSGLLNWPYSYDDGKLAFTFEPGTHYSYSGAGIEIAAKYMAKKANTSWRELAQKEVLSTGGKNEMALGHIPEWAQSRLNMPMNGSGQFKPVEELNPGLAAGDADAAADDLVTSVPAYANLLQRIISETNQQNANLRSTILTELSNDPTYQCEQTGSFKCPLKVGHSVGWQVWQYPDHHVVTHSGSDLGENALVYFSPEKNEGAVIFINGANGWPVIVGIMEILQQEPEMTAHYRQILSRVMNAELQPLLDMGR